MASELRRLLCLSFGWRCSNRLFYTSLNREQNKGPRPWSHFRVSTNIQRVSILRTSRQRSFGCDRILLALGDVYRIRDRTHPGVGKAGFKHHAGPTQRRRPLWLFGECAVASFWSKGPCSKLACFAGSYRISASLWSVAGGFRPSLFLVIL